MREFGDEGNIGVSMLFNDGGGISDLSEYVEKRIVEIKIDSDGRVSQPAVNYALREYMGDLCSSGKSGAINSDGTLREVRKVEF